MTIGEWLHEARQASGLSLVDIVIEIRRELPAALWASTDTIRRIEQKADPNPVLAATLARIYKKPFDEWPEELRSEVEQVQRLLEATRL